jgi:hypothetical protein
MTTTGNRTILVSNSGSPRTGGYRMNEKLTPLTEVDSLRQAMEQLMRRPVPCTWGTLADLAAQIDQAAFPSSDLERMLQRDLRVYAIPTAEAITALESWLRWRGFRRVLEVGAGRGFLAAWLQSAWPEGQVVAQDDGSWKIAPWHPVVTMPLEEALHTVAPDGVISSWMPYGVDWTPVFRATPSVRGYLLIGEGPGGAVGTDEAWATVDGWQETPLWDVADRIWSSTDWVWRDGQCLRHAVVTAWEREFADLWA